MSNKQAGAANIWAVVVILAIVAGGAAFTLMRDDNQTGPGNMIGNNDNMMGENESMMEPVTVKLDAQNNSGQAGTATFTEVDGKTKVVINMTPGSGGLAQPAHIHTGTCANIGGVRYPLSNVVDGRSETVLEPSVHFLHGLGQLAVNVHKSAPESSVYVACGNVTPAMDEAMMMDSETMMEGGMKDEGMMDAGPGAYKDYSESVRESEQQAGNKVVLFFYAAWCPFCRAADADFKANASRIPAGVTVLKVDYDNSTELKTKYGVTYQHTFVQIDNDENQVTKWLSGDTALLARNVK